MKKSIVVPVAIILATVALSLYQGTHQTFSGFDLMLAVCIFFLGMLANSGKDFKNQPAEAPYRITNKGRLMLELGGFAKVFGEES